jgi:hypothetical protein
MSYLSNPTHFATANTASSITLDNVSGVVAGQQIAPIATYIAGGTTVVSVAGNVVTVTTSSVSGTIPAGTPVVFQPARCFADSNSVPSSTFTGTTISPGTTIASALKAVGDAIQAAALTPATGVSGRSVEFDEVGQLYNELLGALAHLQ